MTPLEAYLTELRDIRATGAAVPETSYYPALANLLNGIGAKLRPKVRCIINPANRGAGIPDGGLFTPDQFQRGEPRAPPPGGPSSADGAPAAPIPGQLPSRGVIEAKPPADDAWVAADGQQVTRYWGKYRQVLVTNLRDWVIVSADRDGRPAKMESYRLAESEAAFWDACRHPRAGAQRHGVPFEEFLQRALLHGAPLADPKDVAWFLASYARTALARVEVSGLPALGALRTALAQALGMEFRGPKGEHFFRSTLVQTLFYGVFSAWVLWCKQNRGGCGRGAAGAPPAGATGAAGAPPAGDESPGEGARGSRREEGARFQWHEAAWTLRVPMIRALFDQVATPTRLGPLGLDEVLDWTAAVLNRVDRPAFFSRFEGDGAVQYFYEPFLEAYDPALRKELGVNYTPREIVKYQVARVDTVLREELEIPDGLADPRVYVLDPCCGTAAYLVEVLRHIAQTLKAKGGDALVSQDLKRAAMERVFGFEILPAPFVVAHLQLGLLLQELGAPLADRQDERVGVFLTNALTGWEPPKEPKTKLLFPEMEDEREAADKVKRETPVLVILGNPPYNGFAGVAVTEERALTEAYRTTKRAAAPQGQGLNDLYVRFFRMAERRIVEMNRPAKGVVCFISNYSWLDGLSFTGMRERYLEAFDRVWVDNLHGDRIISEYAPDGKTSETVFAMQGTSPGIKIGTAITLLLRTEKHNAEEARVYFRDHDEARAADRRGGLLASLEETNFQSRYANVGPVLKLGLPFRPRTVDAAYLGWPLLPELFPVSFPGVKTSRDDFLVAVDRERLLARLQVYFDPKVSHEELRRQFAGLMTDTARYKAETIRDTLRKRGLLKANLVRYCYRPFDVRWLYWEPETKLLDEKREDYRAHVFEGNFWIEARQRQPMERFDRGYFVRVMADNFGNGLSNFFPQSLSGPALMAQHELLDGPAPKGKVPNLSDRAKQYLKDLGAKDPETLFFHALATLHAPQYRTENAGALRQDWPRVPLPKTKAALEASAALGREIAGLLDPETPVKGVTVGTIRPELRVLGVVSKEGGGTLDPAKGELGLTVGWGHAGKGGVVMPARGKALGREYTPKEQEALAVGAKALGLKPEDALALLGATTLDVYLNGLAYWGNVPINVWEYTLGGYQVLKKWLSYRERKLLDRDLTMDEARYFTDVCRRVAALLLLGPKLDQNYQRAKEGDRPCH